MVVKNRSDSLTRTIGQIFTPPYISEFMVENIVRLIRKYYYKDHAKPNFKDTKVLDPASGQGIFLKYLLEYNFKDITAYEIDLSLSDYLETFYPEVKFRFENFLGSNSKEKYDIIIGNPPYLGQNYNSLVFQDLVRKYPICKKYFVGNMDLFYYFIHLGITKLKPGGLLSFITTDYWITKSKKTGIKALKPHIIEDCFLLQYIDLSNVKIFKDAQGQHNCIFVLQKKTATEKETHQDKAISTYQFLGDRISEEEFNLHNFMTYTSGLTNNDLNKEKSWNLLYPIEVKKIIEKIEKFCIKDNHISFLKDLFTIRNGLITTKDNIFILKKDKNLQVRENNYFIKIENDYIKINELEKKRLKRLYKGKSIKPYGYDQSDNNSYLIYFNKDEFQNQTAEEFNSTIIKKYPTLTKYILKHQKELKDILINAKENPKDLYFPRRGSFILIENDGKRQEKVNLEPYYDNAPKLFFKYISEKNMFGFCSTQYYATSDTYFLWPKSPHSRVDYPFWIAYLNSKLVTFLFKAKNIKIKRSKTKLEYGLPIPNFDKFQSAKNQSIIPLIRILSTLLINMNKQDVKITLEYQKNKVANASTSKNEVVKEIVQNILQSQNTIDSHTIIKYIDELFFDLFNLDEEEIDYLIKKYYLS